jgi:hypothetical protein
MSAQNRVRGRRKSVPAVGFTNGCGTGLVDVPNPRIPADSALAAAQVAGRHSRRHWGDIGATLGRHWTAIVASFVAWRGVASDERLSEDDGVLRH